MNAKAYKVLISRVGKMYSVLMILVMLISLVGISPVSAAPKDTAPRLDLLGERLAVLSGVKSMAVDASAKGEADPLNKVVKDGRGGPLVQATPQAEQLLTSVAKVVSQPLFGLLSQLP